MSEYEKQMDARWTNGLSALYTPGVRTLRNFFYIQYFYGEMRETMGHVSSHQYILLVVTYFAWKHNRSGHSGTFFFISCRALQVNLSTGRPLKTQLYFSSLAEEPVEEEATIRGCLWSVTAMQRGVTFSCSETIEGAWQQGLTRPWFTEWYWPVEKILYLVKSMLNI